MAKDPAFLFYPNDFLGKTMAMTFEEKGAYIEALIMQFNLGHMGGHLIGQKLGHLWDKIKHKFVQDEQGLWYNKRLEQEIINRKKYAESRRNNLKGNNQHSGSKNKERSHDLHMTSHMENENRNLNRNKKFIKPSLEEIKNYIIENKYSVDPEVFFNHYESKGWVVGDQPMKKWRAAVAGWHARGKKEHIKQVMGKQVADNLESFQRFNQRTEAMEVLSA